MSTRDLRNEPSWSPDGRLIAFAGSTCKGYVDCLMQRPLDVFVANGDGSGQRQLTSSTGNDLRSEYPSWSPNGRSIAVLREFPNASLVEIVSVASGKTRAPHSWPHQPTRMGDARHRVSGSIAEEFERGVHDPHRRSEERSRQAVCIADPRLRRPVDRLVEARRPGRSGSRTRVRVARRSGYDVYRLRSARLTVPHPGAVECLRNHLVTDRHAPPPHPVPTRAHQPEDQAARPPALHRRPERQALAAPPPRACARLLRRQLALRADSRSGVIPEHWPRRETP
jgi:hypothetical protein